MLARMEVSHTWSPKTPSNKRISPINFFEYIIFASKHGHFLSPIYFIKPVFDFIDILLELWDSNKLEQQNFASPTSKSTIPYFMPLLLLPNYFILSFSKKKNLQQICSLYFSFLISSFFPSSTQSLFLTIHIEEKGEKFKNYNNTI